jgi:hypothetical protein
MKTFSLLCCEENIRERRKKKLKEKDETSIKKQ